MKVEQVRDFGKEKKAKERKLFDEEKGKSWKRRKNEAQRKKEEK
jgi:hypothetical protein